MRAQHSWKGLLFTEITMKVDESGMFNPHRDSAPAGALVREGTSAVVSTGERFIGEMCPVILIEA